MFPDPHRFGWSNTRWPWWYRPPHCVNDAVGDIVVVADDDDDDDDDDAPCE